MLFFSLFSLFLFIFSSFSYFIQRVCRPCHMYTYVCQIFVLFANFSPCTKHFSAKHHVCVFTRKLVLGVANGSVLAFDVDVKRGNRTGSSRDDYSRRGTQISFSPLESHGCENFEQLIARLQIVLREKKEIDLQVAKSPLLVQLALF